MNKEEFIKQRCEIDKITEEEFKKRYRVVKCNCGQPYCKGYRCLDLDDLLEENKELKKKYENAVADYETTMAEKEQLKKQLEDISEELELVRCDLHNRTSERDGYERELNECLSQQKEFIKYLECNYKETQDIWYIKILQKYKEIVEKKYEIQNK